MELVKDFNCVLEKVDKQQKNNAIELVRKIKLKYWRCVKEASFFRFLIKFGDLDKVLWLFDSIIESKKKLKKMQPDHEFYGNLQQNVKDLQHEFFEYWKDYDPNCNIVNFVNEMKKPKWIILRTGRNLYGDVVDKIFTIM